MKLVSIQIELRAIVLLPRYRARLDAIHSLARKRQPWRCGPASKFPMSPTTQLAWRPAVCSPKRRREKARQKVMRGKSRVRVSWDEESATSLPYRVTAVSGCARSTSSNALSSWRWKAQTTRSKGGGEVGLVRTRLSSFGNPSGWKRAARRQHLRRECRLREIARVERHQ